MTCAGDIFLLLGDVNISKTNMEKKNKHNDKPENRCCWSSREKGKGKREKGKGKREKGKKGNGKMGRGKRGKEGKREKEREGRRQAESRNCRLDRERSRRKTKIFIATKVSFPFLFSPIYFLPRRACFFCPKSHICSGMIAVNSFSDRVLFSSGAERVPAMSNKTKAHMPMPKGPFAPLFADAQAHTHQRASAHGALPSPSAIRLLRRARSLFLFLLPRLCVMVQWKRSGGKGREPRSLHPLPPQKQKKRVSAIG